MLLDEQGRPLVQEASVGGITTRLEYSGYADTVEFPDPDEGERCEFPDW